MPNPAPSAFHTAMSARRHATGAGPLNRPALRRDAGVALGKVSSLLGYSRYLDQARTWKAGGAAIPAGFERELQAQAGGALTDTRELASAALRMTSQFKQAGHLDRMLSGWVGTLEQTGPVAAADLLADVQHDERVRQTLRDEGISDDVWNTLMSNLAHIDGTVSARDGKLVASLKGGGLKEPRTLVLAPEATGMPRTLADLLRRGSFERQAQLFAQNGGVTLHLLPGPARDLELPEVILAASLLSVQSVAAHTRGVEDAGLAKYTGNAVVVIWAVAALAALVIGYLLEEKYCKHDGSSESAACIAATILFILGALASILLLFAGLLALGELIFGPSSSDGGCNGVYYYSPLDGSSGCGPKSIAPGDSTLP
jgi:hypothetical protein